MGYYTDDFTNKELEKLERKIVGVYRQAYAELDVKHNQYLNGWDEVKDGKTIHHKGLMERTAEQYQAYQDGKYTKEQFDAWCRSQVARADKWGGVRDQMAARLSQANVIASSYINGTTPTVYAENANYESYKIERATGVGSFGIVDEDTVKLLTTGRNSPIPVTSIDLTKDQLWNRQKLNNSLLQGILQGESIGKIADRFQAVTNMNRTSAIRNARTSVTAAQNAGRQIVYKKAEEMEIEIEKEWIATSDERTRESHRMMDGVRIKVGDTYPNGLEYPGDQNGPPEEWWNCRCTERAILPRYNGVLRTQNDVESYKAWKETKQEVKEYWWEEKNDVKRALSVDDFEVLAYGKIEEDIQKEISKSILQLEKKYGIVFYDIEIKSLGTTAHGGGDLLQTDLNKYGSVIIRINEDLFRGKTLEDINQKIKMSDGILANNLYEAIVHEYGHGIAYRGKTAFEIEKMNEEIKNARIRGISNIAFEDGAEAIAEVQILIDRGDEVPKKAMDLYIKYTGGKK